MKKILLMKFCMCIIAVIPITTMNATAITNYEETTIFSTADKYRVTAQTNNEYGKNYWIDIVVEATVASYGTTIHGVFYDDGYGLKRITKYKAYDYADGTYYVSIDFKKYYFTF